MRLIGSDATAERTAAIHPLFGVAIWFAAVSALALQPLGAAISLGGFALLFWRGRPPGLNFWCGLGGLLLSAGLLLTAALTAPRAGSSLAGRQTEIAAAYQQLWDDLEAVAQSAAVAWGQPPLIRRPNELEPVQLATFQLLEARVHSAAPGINLFLLDPSGEVFAWAGDGLLHEPRSHELPKTGLAFHHGHLAVTLFAVAALGDPQRPWRIVAGRSLLTDQPPVAFSRWPASGVRWSLGPAGATSAEQLAIVLQGIPTLFIVEDPARALPHPKVCGWQSAAAAVLAVTLLALARLAGRSSWRWPALPLLLSAGAVMAAGAALGLPRLPTLSLALSVLLSGWAFLGLPGWRAPGWRAPGPAVVRGAGAVFLLLVLHWILGQQSGNLDLARGFGGTVEVFAYRLLGCCLAVGLLAAGAGPRRNGEAEERLVGLTLLLLLAAAAALELWPVAGLLLLAAGAVAVRWLDCVRLAERPAALAILWLVGALLAAISGELVYRLEFRREVEQRFLPAISPPTALEVNQLHLAMFEFLDGYDVARLRPPQAAQVDSQDLAFVLWRESPLAQRDGLSALVVEAQNGDISTFSLGLSLDAEHRLIGEPASWQVPPTRAWQDAMALGEATLTADGQAWGVARFWFLPRPGFRLAVTEIEELEASLLGGQTLRRTIDGLPEPLLYALYTRDGQAIVSPWEGAPPLSQPLLTAGPTQLETPSGRAWAWPLPNEDGGLAVLYLPWLSPRAALERVGIRVLATLLLLAALAGAGWLLTVPQTLALRGLLKRIIRSYSQRLILVYTLLLLLPLVALNLFLLRGFELRLREEQRARGEAALNSARWFLLDFIRGIEPGVGIETRVNRELLEWISGLVQHQINFYWSNRVYASSQQELFTAGLLARRIPGEVYARLALLGYESGSRQQHRGDFVYRELYAPLKMRSASEIRQGLFVSVPLLEQEEEVARELARMRRRAVLVSTGLFLLLLAVGSRLARSFTTPLMELIEGTRRIAAGASELGLAPRERELEALAQAIDEMAQRIASGREKLLHEKQVVERMVENITSGVVSLDPARQVLLHNRVAAEMLGTRVGTSLPSLLAASERLRPVREFLAQVGELSERATLRLAEGEREWTLTWVPLPGADPAALLVVDDVTEVVRGQRLAAWAEMARLIAHEIKNPLTPIRLSAEHLKMVHAQDPQRLDEVFDRCVDNILKQVDELRDLASDFSIYSRIPRAELQPGDLVAVVAELVATYGDALPGGVRVVFSSPHRAVHARFDAKLLRRAVRNLLENAVRASGSSGEVTVRVETVGAAALIRVVDAGPGVPPDFLPRIFEPYFSTHETGTGLGLPITRRIIEEHGGEITAHNRPGAGLEVLIKIPRQDTMTSDESGEPPSSDPP